MVLEALKFMVLGMGVVFAFLVVMVLTINLQAKLIAKFFPEQDDKKPQSGGGSVSASGINSKKVAAIVGAINQHRK